MFLDSIKGTSMLVTDSGSCKQNIIYNGLNLRTTQGMNNKPYEGKKKFNGVCAAGREWEIQFECCLITHMHIKHKEVFMKLYMHQQSSI